VQINPAQGEVSITPMNSKAGNRQSRKDGRQVLKDELVNLLVQEFQRDAEHFRSHFPEIAEKVEALSSEKSRQPKDAILYTHLTEREREFRLNSLNAILGKAAGGEAMSKEEAVKALEDAAALREHAWGSREAVMDLARSAFDLPVVPEKSLSVPLLKGKQVHHTYELIRGVTLSLNWDGKLIRIDLDAKELGYRQKSLAFAGIGSDTKSDVAENHDAYLAEIYYEDLSRRNKL
jgi:hypothetical protein